VTDACYDFCDGTANDPGSSTKQTFCLSSYDAQQLLLLRGGIQDLSVQIQRMNRVVGGGWERNLQVKFYACTIQGNMYPGLNQETGKTMSTRTYL
jgi:hypothetical protein